MAKTISLECPKCHYPAKAEIEKFHKFIIYVCPECQSNVVFYDHKVDIISDSMVNSLKKKKKLRFCGNALFVRKPSTRKAPLPSPEGITRDKILNFKILLETEQDFDTLLSKL